VIRPPLLLLDVDGVLNVLFGTSGTWRRWETGRATAEGRAWPIRWSPDVLQRLCAWHDGDAVELQLAPAAPDPLSGRWWKYDVVRRLVDEHPDVVPVDVATIREVQETVKGRHRWSVPEPGRARASPTHTAHHREGAHVSTVPALPLAGGTSIPQLGFGVYQVQPDETVEVVRTALDVGYRHIDTAQMYENEEGVGKAVEPLRDEVFLTSKLNNGFHRPDDARRAFDETLQRLRTDSVDLFLVHWPLPTLYDGDYVSTWRTLGEFLADGRAKAVGVSNFQVAHLERLAAETDLLPAVNQVEVHPYFGNEQVRAYGAEHGIVTEAWSPIAQGTIVDDPVIGEIATSLGRTPSQVTLRWHVQRGDVVFPKTTKPERMRENFAIFDFALDDAQMDAITALDRGEDGRLGPDPDTFDYVPG